MTSSLDLSGPSLLHDLTRYLVLAALAGASLYGVLNFRGADLRSPNYVTRPERRLWSLFRLVNDEEWTPQGLVYRRRLFRWWGVTVALVLFLPAVW